MGSRSRKYLKKAVKIAFRIAAGIVLLFLLIAALIQIPAIQSSILHRITTVVSDKTGTTVEIDKVRIAFLKSVVVQGLFLDDPQGDTLLSAERIKVNIALKELLFNRINVNSFTLEEVTLNLSRDRADSLFNYQFLIAAFTDTNAPPKSEQKEPSPWSFTIDRVNLENIHARLNDRYGGIDATLALQKLGLRMDGFDPAKTEYHVNRLEIDGLQGGVVMTQGAHSAGKVVVLENEAVGSTPDSAFSASDVMEKILPKISIRRLVINGSSLSYKDIVSRQSAQADLDKFELSNGAVDLENESVTLERFLLAESGFYYAVTPGEKETIDTIEQQEPANDRQLTSGEKSNWKISVDQIDLKDNVLSYLTEGIQEAEDHIMAGTIVKRGEESEVGNEMGSEVESKVESEVDRKKEGEKKGNGKRAEEDAEVEKEKGKVFLASDMEINLHSFSASNLQYSSEKAGGTINSFSATDKNGFAIEKFSGVFRFNEQSFAAERFQLATNHSTVAADLQVQYPSLQALQDSIASVNFTLDLQQLHLRNSDLLYFVPQLSIQPYLNNPEISTSLSGKLSGNIADLAATKLQITTGERTVLQTDLAITGLPAVDSAVFSVPGLRFISGRQDIEMLAGEILPDAIVLPENLSMELAFHGLLNAFQAAAEIESSFGDLQLSAQLDPDESFRGRFGTGDFNLGALLGDTVMFGPVTLTAEVTGNGLERSSLSAMVHADVPKLTLNNYTYRGLLLDGNFSDQTFDGRVGLEDENLVFAFDGLVNLYPGEEHYQFRLDLQGAGLKQLNLTEEDIRLALVAEADVYGTVEELNGRVDLMNVQAVREEQLFALDSLSADFTNIPGYSELQIRSKLLEADYSGTVPPTATIDELIKFMSGYFSLFSEREAASPDDQVEFGKNDTEKQTNFNFSMKISNHPILSEVLFPALKSFEPVEVEGQFDSGLGLLEMDARMNRFAYGPLEIDDLEVVIDTDSSVVHYALSIKSIATEQVELANLMFAGNIGEHGIVTDFTSIDDDLGKKLAVHSLITKDSANYRLTIDPEDLHLMYKQWEIDKENHILFGEEGVMIHRMFLQNGTRKISINSVNEQFNDDIAIDISNFRLGDLSRIIENDTSLVKGVVDASVLLKRVNGGRGIVADAAISNLIVHDVPVGDLTLTTTNPYADRYDLRLELSGAGNDLTATGSFNTGSSGTTMDITAAIASLSMKTVEAFAPRQVSETAGTLSGSALISGPVSSPKATGELHFNEVFVNPAVLNNRLGITNETIQLKSDGLWFDTFTVTDAKRQTATLDGSVKMTGFRDFIFDLKLKADDFLLMNTTVKDNETVFGRVVIDSDIDISGPMELPVVRGRLKLKDGSQVAFVVPESRLTTDRGENVVVFENPTERHAILDRGISTAVSRSSITGVDLTSIIEVDRQASLRLFMDPTSSDSLVVRGEAALSLTMDRSGKVSLTGVYSLDEGSYLVSLESVIKRKFSIVPGSSITWNGDPLEASLSLNARYEVRASPYDLVASQMSGLSDADRGAYKQQIPFWVLLKLRGEMLHPEISFEIQLPPEEKGALDGAVNQKLLLLNENESALNKQVFALLLLGRFIQENPLQTESGSTASIVRSTVGNFLSAQLNRLGAGVLPGTELNVDIQSYEEYQAEQPQGRTEVEVGIKQQLFNERLSVQVGGTVDVEGERALQNAASDITGDVTVEYKLTEDGRLRLKGFRHSQYEGALDGQIIETGAGVSYVRDFNRWKELFRAPDAAKKRDKKTEEQQE